MKKILRDKIYSHLGNNGQRINELDVNVDRLIQKFAVNAKIGGVESSEEQQNTQRHFVAAGRAAPSQGQRAQFNTGPGCCLCEVLPMCGIPPGGPVFFHIPKTVGL